jgi:hypothetical protein
MVCVDLVGPFIIKVTAKTHSLLALTMIDSHTGWFEIVKARNKSATFIQDLFHNTWLTCYPRPQFIVFSNGNMGEFRLDFNQMCESIIMALKPNQLQVTTYHQRANSVIG